MRGGAPFAEGCPLLLLYTYITSRPDEVASDAQWLQLEQEVNSRAPSVNCPPPDPTSGPLFPLLLGSTEFSVIW